MPLVFHRPTKLATVSTGRRSWPQFPQADEVGHRRASAPDSYKTVCVTVISTKVNRPVCSVAAIITPVMVAGVLGEIAVRPSGRYTRDPVSVNPAPSA